MRILILCLVGVLACDPGPTSGNAPPPPDAGGDPFGGWTFDDGGDLPSPAPNDASPTEPDVALAPPPNACARPIATGDLRVSELMIASVSGSGDHGEWLEVTSTLECSIDLDGLHGECPRGSTVVTFDVVGRTWLPPRGTFVVADSADPAINHYLPGLVLAWTGASSDILRNGGTTVTLTRGGVLVDTLTYRTLPTTVGASLAFPDDCTAEQRTEWTTWKTSTASWFPGFLGTPNAPNDDVACP